MLRHARIILKDTAQYMKQAQLLLVASSLAYTTILSIIPLLAVSFAIFQAFGGLKSVNDVIEPFIVSNLAEGVGEDVVSKIEGFITNAHASVIGVGGLVGLIVTSMSALSSIEKAINRVWHAPMTRSLFHRLSSYWLFITLGPVALAVAVGAATSSHLPLSDLFPTGTGAYLLTALLFTGVYKWVPHTRVRARCAVAAGLLMALVFHLAQFAFRFYTSHVLSYSKIYGSLGAVPIVLLWIYIVWIIVLTGAAFTAALQKQVEVILQQRARQRAASGS
jgi:membrane protein